MTVTLTPSGMVEPGVDFHGNAQPPHSAQVEVGPDFQGNSPVSTPTADANIKISNPGN